MSTGLGEVLAEYRVFMIACADIAWHRMHWLPLVPSSEPNQVRKRACEFFLPWYRDFVKVLSTFDPEVMYEPAALFLPPPPSQWLPDGQDSREDPRLLQQLTVEDRMNPARCFFHGCYDWFARRVLPPALGVSLTGRSARGESVAFPELDPDHLRRARELLAAGPWTFAANGEGVVRNPAREAPRSWATRLETLMRDVVLHARATYQSGGPIGVKARLSEVPSGGTQAAPLEVD
jgi:hypothetical protein